MSTWYLIVSIIVTIIYLPVIIRGVSDISENLGPFEFIAGLFFACFVGLGWPLILSGTFLYLLFVLFKSDSIRKKEK